MSVHAKQLVLSTYSIVLVVYSPTNNANHSAPTAAIELCPNTDCHVRILDVLPVAAHVAHQAASREYKTRFHLPDGPRQQERDAQMAQGSTDWSFKAVAWIYGHDAGVVDDLIGAA